jgi:plasmid replication initiation protein
MPDYSHLEIGADPKKVVAKSNDLVRGRHDFSTLEQRIFVAMVAQLNREDEFPVVEIPLAEVSELSGTDKSNLYREAQRLCDTLASRTIGVHDTTDEEGTPRYTSYPCFRFCRHVKGTGVIQAKFSDDLKPYLLRLKKKFTLYLLKVFLRLRSKYSTQIYELMKMRQGVSRLEMSVEEFRYKLGLEEKYSRFSSLRARVIDQAQEELSEKADVYFTYRVLREGRTPKRLEFFVKENTEVIENLQEEVSSLEGDHGPRHPSDGAQELPTPSGTGPESVDAKKLFLSDRTQEEIDALSGSNVDRLYREAYETMEEAHGDASDTYIESMVARKMERLWEGE